MSDLGTLLAYFIQDEDTREGLRQLRRKGFRRSARIYKPPDRDVQVTQLSRARWALWGLFGSLIAIGVFLTLTFFAGYSQLQPAAAGLSAIFGAIVGWFLGFRLDPGVDPELIKKHARWTVAGDSLCITQASPADMATALPMLRDIGETHPSIFALYPERDFESPASPMTHAPLSPTRLRQHTLHMAADHKVTINDSDDEPLLTSLKRCGNDLEQIRQDLTVAVRLEQSVSPSAEWILDNAYIVQSHIQDVEDNLPKKFYHELPELTSAHLKGLPRTYAMATELVRHTEGHLTQANISDLLEDYQSTSILSIGELWAMPLMLRIALIESLCQLAEQVYLRLRERELADFWSTRLLAVARREPNQLFSLLAELSAEHPYPSPYFAFQLTSHLYDEQAALIPVQSWIERTLHSGLADISVHEQGRQAASQVFIGNAITSLRELALLDWRDVFESHSEVDSILQNDPVDVYGSMDFETRDRYRSAVEEIARTNSISEGEVARAAIHLASRPARDETAGGPQRHVGYFLIDDGRGALIDEVGGMESTRQSRLRWITRHATSIYLSTVGILTAGLVTILLGLGAMVDASPLFLGIATLASILPASQLAVQIVNYLAARLLPPLTLPKLSFEKEDIPDRFRTLIIVPVIFADEATIHDEIEKLEIRYLANPNSNLVFGVFGDYGDSDQQVSKEDNNLLSLAISRIQQLNARYDSNRFFLFSRDRVWTESEDQYIGWERKRGKLEELNRLLAGEASPEEREVVRVGEPDALAEVRFVITLDSDTQLPRDSARRLVETLAHPLNHSQDGYTGNGSGGPYTIIQPRMSTSLPSATATSFSRLFTDPVGSDPYTKAVSDVYQDLAGEGSYHGKGIYDPRSFHRTLSGRFPEQRLLSHDLLEGAYVRTALASDIELFDEFPQDYQTYSRRLHRWIRGDWQISAWWSARVPSADGKTDRNPLSLLNRWKIFDNLRRSLVPAGIVLFLLAAWLSSPSYGALVGISVTLLLFFQPLSELVTMVTTLRNETDLTVRELSHDVSRAISEVALLPHQAGLALDAIARVWYRRLVSRKRLLEWTTAQIAQWQKQGQSTAFLLNMGWVSLASVGIGFLVWTVQPASLRVSAPFLIAWFVSPLVGWWLNSSPRKRSARAALSSSELDLLRKLARRTWRYFNDFVDEDTSWLPPDNYQVSHQNQLAMRTSPTNIGLWLLSALGAHDFGYLTADQVIHRVGQTFRTLKKLERFEGHLLNWYDLSSLQPLHPRYVSMVDSGNLLACLWTLESGFQELIRKPIVGPHALAGLFDTLMILRGELDSGEAERHHEALLLLESILRHPPELTTEIIHRIRLAIEPATKLADDLREGAGLDGGGPYWSRQLERQVSAWADVIDRYLAWLESLGSMAPELENIGGQVSVLSRLVLAESPTFESISAETSVPLKILREALEQMDRPSDVIATWLDDFNQQLSVSHANALETFENAELQIQNGHDLASGMNMKFLYDDQRRLFNIGFNVDSEQLDGSHYDLLASEARLGSFVCIARGDVPTGHWLALHRPHGLIGRRRALLSWTGTMFEYLMPGLLMRNFENSLLDRANREAVRAHIRYGRQRGVPWGISESAYGDLDLNMTYQYKAFGVPGLGLKRGLGEDLVVAPYATMLGLGVDPQASVRNLTRLEGLGLLGSYGYYEAIDFSRRREREGEHGVLVRTFMAHHQSMSFLALVNLVHDQAMQQRFHADPRVQSAEPLLYERIPASPPLHHLPSEGRPLSRVSAAAVAPAFSKFNTPHSDTPRTQLLSNGRQVLMVTSAGGGFSRWGDFDLTRWRADTTRDSWGTFCYLRDVDSDDAWSNSYQPLGGAIEDYSVSFAADRAEISRSHEGIHTETTMFVSPGDDVEFRRITLTNESDRIRNIELTSYLELALAPHNADRQHPAFNKLFIQTEAIPELEALMAYRRPRSPDDPPIYVGHRMAAHDGDQSPWQFETDRLQFIGRYRSTANPAALGTQLSNSEGHVLDPIFSLRRSVVLEPEQRVQFTLVLCASETRDGLLKLLEKYGDGEAINRELDLAWAHSQLGLRLQRIQPDEARRYQQLASSMLYPNEKLRPPHERLRQNTSSQAHLWPYGISGDLPIALVTIAESRDVAVVQQLLKAHTYWRLHGLMADLLILNEESSSYEQPLHEQLERMIKKQTTLTSIDHHGGVFLRTVDQIPEEDLSLMLASAQISLVAARGPLAQQLGLHGEAVELPDLLETKAIELEPAAELPFMELEHFNGLGGFTTDGREYVIALEHDNLTPAPWVNVIANPGFGTVVSEAGSGYVWSGNSQSNRLTSWSNDPVSDPAGEAIYIRDEETGDFWTPTPLPIREEQTYRVRHGAGYTVFEHNSHAIEQELTTFVPMSDDGGDPVRVQRLILRNDSTHKRKLSVTFYVEWNMGESREASQMHVRTTWDRESGVLIARNAFHADYGDKYAFASIDPVAEDFTADRIIFLGRNRSMLNPAAMERVTLSGRAGAGLDPCAAMRVRIDLDPGEAREITCLLGQAGTLEDVQQLVDRYREHLSLEESYARTVGWWDRFLTEIQVETPDHSVNLLLNRWLLYQSLSCRIWGRSAFYQSGGAFGFRDQLQDVLSLLYIKPDLAREQILLSASRQFREGDVQHWWHPPSGAGIRSRCSDDLLWLPYAVSQYVHVTGDKAILDIQIPFLAAQLLEDDEHELYLQPDETLEQASLYEHCRRAIERGTTEGPHGLPLIGLHDWNDGMNRVGLEGKGESVWLAWFLVDVLNRFAVLSETVAHEDLAQGYRDRASSIAQAIELHAWDGNWYRRAYFDDGTPIGSAASDEAKIDSLPQSWAWISGAANPEKVGQATESAWKHLVKSEDQLVLLFTPPFDISNQDPGYIKGYPPGVRENGGQYTHAALWLAIAFARQGKGERAVDLLNMLNPINHTSNPEQVERYGVEPYVVAADVYRLAGRVGQGGWTWYTGSASWMYRAWIEEVLGMKVSNERMVIDPVIPAKWDGFNIRYRYGQALYEITVENPEGVGRGVVKVEMDGHEIEDHGIPLEDRSIKHNVRVLLGKVEKLVD